MKKTDQMEQMNTSDILCMMWSYKNIRLLCYKCFIQVFRFSGLYNMPCNLVCNIYTCAVSASNTVSFSVFFFFHGQFKRKIQSTVVTNQPHILTYEPVHYTHIYIHTNPLYTPIHTHLCIIPACLPYTPVYHTHISIHTSPVYTHLPTIHIQAYTPVHYTHTPVHYTHIYIHTCSLYIYTHTYTPVHYTHIDTPVNHT